MSGGDFEDLIPKLPKELPAGMRFGRYVITRKIGEGAMAMVYEAEHTDLQKRVALKTLHHFFAIQQGVVQRFVREARTASKIQHPHVVGISDIGVEQGVPFLAADLLEGEELRMLIARDGQLAVERVADLLLPVTSAVYAAHEAGVLHRDLKPENIFLAQRKPHGTHPVLLDFGISKAPGTKGSMEITGAGEVLGTPPYMSPEQVIKGMDVFDERSDQYALGVILFEMVTGVLPYADEDVRALMIAIAHGGAPPPSALNANVPPAFDAMVERAMSVSPGDRYPTVLDLGRALYPFASRRVRALWAAEFADTEPESVDIPVTTTTSGRPMAPPPSPSSPGTRWSSRPKPSSVPPDDLRVIPIFEDATDEELAALLSAGKSARFSAGEALAAEGDAAARCFFVLAGEVLVKGYEVDVTLGRGSIVGARALHDTTRYTHAICARTDVRALSLDPEGYAALASKSPTLVLRLDEAIAASAARAFRLVTAYGERTATLDNAAIARVRAAIDEWAVPLDDPDAARARRRLG